ncbi:MAG: phytoene/squalene synthase family protein [Candidatus Omnitrophota bacterium]
MAMPDGFRQAKEITKKHAKTFYFASHFLGRAEKYAAYAIYAFCRTHDDAVDVANQELNADLIAAFQETVTKYQIPKEYFNALKSGVNMDLSKNRYQDFAELYDYCYKVAGVVGLIMLKIFSNTDNKAEKYAVDLGIAMQLTNILRDIKEDFARGRIYLPLDEMQSHCVNEIGIRQERLNDNFRALMRFQTQRARQYYQESLPGIKLIPGVKSRFCLLAMKNIYAGILEKIERNNYDVYKERAHVNMLGKITIILKILFKGEYL